MSGPVFFMRENNMKRFIYVLLVLALIAAGCSERDLPVPNDSSDNPVVEKFSVPEIVNPSSSYPVMVRVEPSDLVESVSLEITLQGSSSPIKSLSLYDDGGAVDSNDGDAVAYDGIFSQVLNWDQTEASDLIFTFSAKSTEGQLLSDAAFSVKSTANSKPVIIDISIPDSLKSGESGQQFIVTVSDSNGTEDIKSVVFTGMQNNAELFNGELQPTGTPGEFVITIDSSFAAGKKGSYDIVFSATDQSNVSSDPATRILYIENTYPELGEISAPRQIERPPLDYIVNFLIEVPISDAQGLGDIKEVRVSWQKPDASYPGGSPYQLFDNGLEYSYDNWDQGYRGDLTANDGVYSITGVFDPDDLLGNYILIFWAEDLAGNRSSDKAFIINLKDTE